MRKACSFDTSVMYLLDCKWFQPKAERKEKTELILLSLKDGAYYCYCASPDTRISYRQCLLIQEYFCAV